MSGLIGTKDPFPTWLLHRNVGVGVSGYLDHNCLSCGLLHMAVCASIQHGDRFQEREREAQSSKRSLL